jgi:hypothetical protein
MTRERAWDGTYLAAVAGSAVVGVGYWLGATWLGEPLAGVPAGIWLVLGLAAAHRTGWLGGPAATEDVEVAAQPSAAAQVTAPRPAEAGSLSTAAPVSTLAVPAWPTSPRTSAAMDGLGRAVGGAARLVVGADPDCSRVKVCEEQLISRLEASEWPARPIRVGIGVESGAAEQLKHGIEEGGGEAVVVRDRVASDSPEEICESQLLDAVVTPSRGGVRITTLERKGREAGWFDWGAARPLSYVGLFPFRLDCSQVSLWSLKDMQCAAPETVAIAMAAAACTRTEARLRLIDRLRGRRSDPSLGDFWMSRLGAIVSALGEAPEPSVGRALARTVSAWAVTSPGLDDEERARLAEAAAAVAGDEPEVMLRLAAARFASLRDSAGIDALLRADRLIRSAPDAFSGDQSAFVQSDMVHAPYSSLLLGKVAAGICLACASADTRAVAYLLGDFMDDMRYSGWLVGRDQDRAVLSEVFRALERARRAETYALPAAA